jgi:hypothetical protein
MRPALDPAGHRVPRTKPTCLLHTWRPHRRRPFALVLHLHQHQSSRNLHLQYLTKSQSTQHCQSLITQGSDHPGPRTTHGPHFTTLVPWNSAVRLEQKFCIFLRAEVYRNDSKHTETSFWVQQTRMNASQHWYPEIVHSGPKYKFCIFYVPKVSEMLWNTSKHHFGSNVLDWMCTTLVPRNSALRHETHVLHLFTRRRLAKCTETLSDIILGPID